MCKYQRDATFRVYLVFFEPWNIIHTANNSYTGFILPRTYDTRQWLPLQFCKITPDDGHKLRPKHVELLKKPNKQEKLHLVGIYTTSRII